MGLPESPREDDSSITIIERLAQELKDTIKLMEDKAARQEAIEAVKAGHLELARSAQTIAADAAAGKTIVGSARSTSSHIVAATASGLPHIKEAVQVIVPLAIAMDVISNVVQFIARKSQSYGMTRKEKYLAYAFNGAAILLSTAAMATFFTLAFPVTAAIFSVYGAIDSFKEFRNIYRNRKANKTIEAQLNTKRAELAHLEQKLLDTEGKENREWKIDALKKKITQVKRHIQALEAVQAGKGTVTDHQIVKNWTNKAKEEFNNSMYSAVTRGLTSIGYALVAVPFPPVMIAGGFLVASVALVGVSKLAVGAISKRWKNYKEKELTNHIAESLKDPHPRSDLLSEFVSKKAEEAFIEQKFEESLNDPDVRHKPSDPIEREKQLVEFKSRFYEGLSEAQKKSLKHEAFLLYGKRWDTDPSLMRVLKAEYPKFKIEKLQEEKLRQHFRESYLSQFEPAKGASAKEIKEAKKQKKIALKGIKSAEDYYLKKLDSNEKEKILGHLNASPHLTSSSGMMGKVMEVGREPLIPTAASAHQPRASSQGAAPAPVVSSSIAKPTAPEPEAGPSFHM